MRQRVASSHLMLFWMVLFTVVAVRFVFLQVVYADFFTNLAANQYWTSRPYRQGRGRMLDRFGKPLVINELRSSLFIDPSHVGDKHALQHFLTEHYPDVIVPQTGQFVWLERMISDEQKTILGGCNCSDVHACDEPARYLTDAYLSGVVGRTDIDGVGISGIESMYDQQLASVPGWIRFQKDARSGNQKYVMSEVTDPGTCGTDIQLTISKALQRAVGNQVAQSRDRWHAKEVAAIVLDPMTGEILSAVSVKPDGFDDDRFGPIVDCYEFGSVMKIFVALAALDEGVVTLDEVIDCQGDEASVDGFMVRNWTTLGELPFSDVLARSSNVGLAKIACRLGKPLYDHLFRLGFGQKTGVDFPGERQGHVSHPKQWSRSSLQALSFGYEMNASLLQLASAMGIILSDGTKQQPHFLLSGDCDRWSDEVLYSENSLKMITEALSGVDERYWMGSQLKKIEGLQVTGKTGTARCLVDGQYCEDKHLYTFVGGIKKGDYARVIVTFLSQAQGHDLYASQTAAPLFYSIARQVVMHDLIHGHL